MENTCQRGASKHVPKTKHVKGSRKKKVNVGWTRLEDTMIKAVIEEEPIGKRQVGRPRLRWEDCVKRNVKAVVPRANRKEVAEDRERWRNLCCTGWS